MSRVADILRVVTSIDEPIVDRAMAASLASADEAALRVIVDALLDRGDPHALVDVVTRYDRLPKDLQHRVAEHDAALYRPLREAARRRDPQVRLNVVRIISAAQSARLAYLVAEQLRHGPRDVHDEAAACLLAFTKLAATRDSQGSMAHKPPFDAAATGYLLAAVEDAVLAYGQHSQQPVLESLCELAPRTLPKVMTHLGLSDSKALADFRTLLESGRQPSIRRSLLSFLSVPTLFGAVIAGLRRAADEGQIEVVFSSTYLLASPRHARALARVADPETFLLEPDRIAQLEPEHARGLVRWVTTLPLAPKQRVVQLASMHRLRDAAARLCALRALIETSTRFGVPGADAVISGYCFDPDVHTARLALRHLLHKNWKELPPLLLKLVNSPHQDIRTLAADRIAPIGFDRLWQTWPTLPYAQQLETGKALLKIDSRFERKLAKHLAEPVEADRLRALNMIHVLSLGVDFAKALIALCHSRDTLLASAAVRALGSVPSDDAKQALETCLKHEDSRVRANAVEALQQQKSTAHVQELVEMAEHDEGRPRANAIGALIQMRAGDAMGSLTRMLDDNRPRQRVSALWLVEHMGIIDVARQVAEMSISDHDEHVRDRAERAVRQLIQVMSHTADQIGMRPPEEDAA